MYLHFTDDTGKPTNSQTLHFGLKNIICLIVFGAAIDRAPSKPLWPQKYDLVNNSRLLDKKEKIMHYIALSISIILGVIGQIFLKLSTVRSNMNDYNFYYINLNFIIAAIIYVSSLLFYTYSLNRIPLTLAYPMVSLSYIGVAIASRYVFGTSLGYLDFFGFALIMAGVSVIAVSQVG